MTAASDACRQTGCRGKSEQPDYIITSVLDTDFYKLTMGQFIFDKYPDVPVKYSFKNRTANVFLAQHIREGDFRRELDHVRDLRLTDNEAAYLLGLRASGRQLFSERYIEFLRGLRLPDYTVTVSENNIDVSVAGNWGEAIYWEIFILSTLNELYFRSLRERLRYNGKKEVFAEGLQRLDRKISLLKAGPPVSFSDFGTRRRFSREWHDLVICRLCSDLPGTMFTGTSNVFLARKYGIAPIGTMAHELFMVMSGIMHGDESMIYASHNRVLQDWWDYYGADLAIALTDTYSTDFFFRDMTHEQTRNYRGLRQDSGDPIAFGEQAIRFYESRGIDPREKVIVFSDGLDIDTILRLAGHFAGRINYAFGWGTNLTNDLGFGPLSLVVKVVEACGHATVKLSDNLAKAIGAQQDIERFKRIFGYTGTTHEECRY
jgi:nicotinate phosphoribosyltransferase